MLIWYYVDKVFARKESLVKHICNLTEEGCEIDESSYLCHYCHKTFATKHLLRRHTAKHTGQTSNIDLE